MFQRIRPRHLLPTRAARAMAREQVKAAREAAGVSIDDGTVSVAESQGTFLNMAAAETLVTFRDDADDDGNNKARPSDIAIDSNSPHHDDDTEDEDISGFANLAGDDADDEDDDDHDDEDDADAGDKEQKNDEEEVVLPSLIGVETGATLTSPPDSSPLDAATGVAVGTSTATAAPEAPPVAAATPPPGKKKPRVQQKRLVGTPAMSIKQMKDSVVRAQAKIAAKKVATVIEMTRYKSWEQKQNNPPNETYLLNFDCIVHRPDLVGEGMRSRKPIWTVMMPDDIDVVSFGEELVKLGQALQDPKGSKKRAREWGLVIVKNATDYFESIYGKKQKINDDEEEEE